MKGNDKAGNSGKTLRQRAEKKLVNVPADISGLSPEELQTIIHDLHVHQIELEMQNEELQHIYLELKQANERYADLYDFAPVGYFITNLTNIILNVNLTFCCLLGIERGKLLGKRVTQYIDRKFLDAYFLHRRQAFQSGSKKVCEVLMHRADGSPFYARLESVPCGQDQLRVAVIDVTEEKEAKDALIKARAELETKVRERTAELKKSEAKYRDVVENANEIIVVVQDDRLKFFNSKAMELTGYSSDDLNSIDFTDFIYSEDREMVVERYRQRLRGAEVSSVYEFRIKRKDGEIRWVQIKAALINWEEKPAVLGMISDITESRILLEEKERFARRLIYVQEEERNRISRELHDDTAQWLALLTLEMDSVIDKSKDVSPETIARLQKLRETTEKSLREVRRFSHELRPSVLEHFGLAAALELIVNEFNEAVPAGRTTVRLDIQNLEKRLPEETELVLFRIAQESLSNIRKHAQATEAMVRLTRNNSVVSLTVSDNGIGFDPHRKPVDSISSGLGLIGMQERAEIIGGKLTIRSSPGKGTTVSVRVPVKGKGGAV